MSNTEQMVSVPRELAETFDRSNSPPPAWAVEKLRAILDQPADQPHGEPVALPEPCGDLLPLERDGWNACLDKIAKLGPLYSRPVQGEPVAWRYQTHAGGLWYLSSSEHNARMFENAEKGSCVEPLYTHADAGDPFEVLANHCAQSAIEEGIKNYSGASYTIDQDNGESFELVITVQRKGAVSPQEANEALKSQLAERDALLRELAEAAEVFSCSAHCETSDAGDALELLNAILARVNTHKEPKCRVCGYKLHPDGYCSFRDCWVPGKGTRALSASAEPSAPKCGVCGQGAWACNEGGCHYLESGNGEPSAPVERDERADFEAWVSTRKVCTHKGATLKKDRAGNYLDYRINDRWLTWQARAALERKQ